MLTQEACCLVVCLDSRRVIRQRTCAVRILTRSLCWTAGEEAGKPLLRTHALRCTVGAVCVHSHSRTLALTSLPQARPTPHAADANAPRSAAADAAMDPEGGQDRSLSQSVSGCGSLPTRRSTCASSAWRGSSARSSAVSEDGPQRAPVHGRSQHGTAGCNMGLRYRAGTAGCCA
jgi:hypothetical protein